jgi:SAM-dependent methyltransferase
MSDPQIMAQGAYLDVTYSVERAPYGPYPGQLARHVADTYFLRPGALADFGCGRGEFLSAFADLGYDVAGVDISPRAPSLAPGHKILVADLEKEPLPLPAGSFDFAYSKSVVEHLHAPVTFLEKINQSLKPGGMAVVMTPSWEYNYWGPFYIDHTHVTPFTAPSLTDAMIFAGFTDVKTIYFWQLPFLWRWPMLTPLVRLMAKFPFRYAPMYDVSRPAGWNKLIRFSKEVMLLSVGTKPG